MSENRICRGCRKKNLKNLLKGLCRSCRSTEALLGNVQKRQETIFYRKWLKSSPSAFPIVVNLNRGSSGRFA